MQKALWLATALAFALAAPAAAQKVPRTVDGKPDLSGVWTNASVTNLTRPPSVQKLAVSEAEAIALVKANPFQQLIDAEEGPSDTADNLLDDGNADRGYNAFWIDPGRTLALVKGEFRTSWIVEPANGQMPLSDEGRKRLTAARADREHRGEHRGPEPPQRGARDHRREKHDRDVRQRHEACEHPGGQADHDDRRGAHQVGQQALDHQGILPG